MGFNSASLPSAWRRVFRQPFPSGPCHDRGRRDFVSRNCGNFDSFSYQRGLAGSISSTCVNLSAEGESGARRGSITTTCTRRSPIARRQLNGCRTACDQFGLDAAEMTMSYTPSSPGNLGSNATLAASSAFASCCSDQNSFFPTSSCARMRTLSSAEMESPRGSTRNLNFSPGAKTRLSRSKRTRSKSPGARIASKRFPRWSNSLFTKSPERSARGISIDAVRSGSSAAVNRSSNFAPGGADTSTSVPSYPRGLRWRKQSFAPPLQAGASIHIEPGSSASSPSGRGSEMVPSLTETVPCQRRSSPPPQAMRTRMSPATAGCAATAASRTKTARRNSPAATVQAVGKKRTGDVLGPPCPIIVTPAAKEE